jgi:hypothetical protein
MYLYSIYIIYRYRYRYSRYRLTKILKMMDTFDCKFIIEEIDKIINNNTCNYSSSSSSNLNGLLTIICPIYTLSEPEDTSILNTTNLDKLNKISPIDSRFELPTNYKSKLIQYLVHHQFESLSLNFEETKKMYNINQHLNTIIYLLNRSQTILGAIDIQNYNNNFDILHLASLFEENSNKNINILSLFINLMLNVKDEVCLDFSSPYYKDLNIYQIMLLSKVNIIMDWIDNTNTLFEDYPNIDLNKYITSNDINIKMIYESVLVIYNFCQIIFYILSLEEL